MRTIHSEFAPQPIGPYSQGIEVDGFIFLSGQVGLNPKTGELLNGLVEQTDQVMENISSLLKSASLSFSHIVKSTVYLKDIKDFSEFNKTYTKYFKENPPARTTIEVSALPRNALVEIDIIAHK